MKTKRTVCNVHCAMRKMKHIAVETTTNPFERYGISSIPNALRAYDLYDLDRAYSLLLHVHHFVLLKSFLVIVINSVKYLNDMLQLSFLKNHFAL